MCGKLDCYLKQFAKLRTDKNRQRWSAETCHRAPHKPLLLLSIFDHIASKTITRNFIEPSFGLAQTFQQYWWLVMPIGKMSSVSFPFYYTETDAFWKLVLQPGHTDQRDLTVSSVRRLQELYLGTRFNDELEPF